MTTIVGLQLQMAAGEIPLNRKGMLLTGDAEDEDMVFTAWKHADALVIWRIYEYNFILSHNRIH